MKPSKASHLCKTEKAFYGRLHLIFIEEYMLQLKPRDTISS